MKKIIYISIVFLTIALLAGCKKDKKAIAPIQDTISNNFEEYFTDESDTIIPNKDTVATDTVIMKEDKQGNLQPATNEDLNNPQKKFYIIVGSYTKMTNAEKRRDHFTKLGYSAKILPPNGKLNRVAVSEYSDETQARQDLKAYRSKFGDKSFWLLLR